LPDFTRIERNTFATLVGPQIEEKLCERRGVYFFATGSAHARSSRRLSWYAGWDLMEDREGDERSKGADW
jgi:hypothetical protein